MKVIDSSLRKYLYLREKGREGLDWWKLRSFV